MHPATMSRAESASSRTADKIHAPFDGDAVRLSVRRPAVSPKKVAGAAVDPALAAVIAAVKTTLAEVEAARAPYDEARLAARAAAEDGGTRSRSIEERRKLELEVPPPAIMRVPVKGTRIKLTAVKPGGPEEVISDGEMFTLHSEAAAREYYADDAERFAEAQQALKDWTKAQFQAGNTPATQRETELTAERDRLFLVYDAARDRLKVAKGHLQTFATTAPADTYAKAKALIEAEGGRVTRTNGSSTWMVATTELRRTCSS
jgi:hypothetical protein